MTMSKERGFINFLGRKQGIGLSQLESTYSPVPGLFDDMSTLDAISRVV
jgi:hypothetical protein